MYIFYYSGFLSNLRLPWKTESALNSLYWICIFYYSGFLSNQRLPWKTECALKIFTILNILFAFRIIEQLALDLKTEFALKFFKGMWGGVPPWPPSRTPMVTTLGRTPRYWDYTIDRLGVMAQKAENMLPKLLCELLWNVQVFQESESS